eukprot:Hpha_TRINITY_DN8557_c0_g1::TRINITY_DN8557_c0_g1_i1::g.146470::m.146470
MKDWDPSELLGDIPKAMKKILEAWDFQKTVAALARREQGDGGEEKGPTDIGEAEAALKRLDEEVKAAGADASAELKAKRNGARKAYRELRAQQRTKEIRAAGGVELHEVVGVDQLPEWLAGGEEAERAGRCRLVLGQADSARRLGAASVVVELAAVQPQRLREVLGEAVVNGRVVLGDMGTADSLEDLVAPLDAAAPGLAAVLLHNAIRVGSVAAQLLGKEPPPDALSKFRFAALTASKSPQKSLLSACYVVAVGASAAGGPQNLGGIYRGLRDGEDVYGDGECMQERMEKFSKMEPLLPKINAAGIAYTKVGEMLEMKGTRSQFSVAGL